MTCYFLSLFLSMTLNTNTHYHPPASHQGRPGFVQVMSIHNRSSQQPVSSLWSRVLIFFSLRPAAGFLSQLMLCLLVWFLVLGYSYWHPVINTFVFQSLPSRFTKCPLPGSSPFPQWYFLMTEKKKQHQTPSLTCTEGEVKANRKRAWKGLTLPTRPFPSCCKYCPWFL